MAIEKVKPIKRIVAKMNLTEMILSKGITTTEEAIDYFLNRFLSVSISRPKRVQLINYLDYSLGSNNLLESESYLEDPLRLVLHLILSEPEYQLG